MSSHAPFRYTFHWVMRVASTRHLLFINRRTCLSDSNVSCTDQFLYPTPFSRINFQTQSLQLDPYLYFWLLNYRWILIRFVKWYKLLFIPKKDFSHHSPFLLGRGKCFFFSTFGPTIFVQTYWLRMTEKPLWWKRCHFLLWFAVYVETRVLNIKGSNICVKSKTYFYEKG